MYALLQLQGSGYQPLTQQSRQQTAAALAQAVGQGVVPGNVTVTLPQVHSVTASAALLPVVVSVDCALLCK